MIRYHSTKAILLLLMSAGLAASCSRPAEKAESSESNQPLILARINGNPVYLSEFSRYIQSFLNDDPEEMGYVSTRELFGEYLTQTILLTEAEKAGIEVTEKELDGYINEWATSQDGLDAQAIESSISEYLKVQKLLKQNIEVHTDITLQELINYYDEHIEGFSVGDQVHVLEILTSERDQAEELKARVNNGDSRKFREMAMAFSRGATAEAEGDLGFFEKGDLPEEFDKVIFSLAPGEISDPFQSAHGYHLFFMEEWIPSHQYKFHEVKAEIFQVLADRKEREQTEEYINSLLNQYSITIYESSFPVDSKEYNFDQNDS